MTRALERPASRASFTGRLPESLYRDARDLALALDRRLDELLVDGIESFVRAQLGKPVVATAVERMRAARAAASPAGVPRSRAGGRRSKASKTRKPT